MILMTKLEQTIKGIVIYQLEQVFHHLKETKNIQPDQGIGPLVKITQSQAFLIDIKMNYKRI